MSEVKEKGAAGFICELSNGIISIYHQEDKTLLKEWIGSGNDWETIWELFETLSKNENKNV